MRKRKRRRNRMKAKTVTKTTSTKRRRRRRRRRRREKKEESPIATYKTHANEVPSLSLCLALLKLRHNEPSPPSISLTQRQDFFC